MRRRSGSRRRRLGFRPNWVRPGSKRGTNWRTNTGRSCPRSGFSTTRPIRPRRLGFRQNWIRPGSTRRRKTNWRTSTGRSCPRLGISTRWPSRKSNRSRSSCSSRRHYLLKPYWPASLRNALLLLSVSPSVLSCVGWWCQRAAATTLKSTGTAVKRLTTLRSKSGLLR